MSQTRENRIFRHYKALRKERDYRNGEPGPVWMTLARHWGIPIRELKEIIREEREKK